MTDHEHDVTSAEFDQMMEGSERRVTLLPFNHSKRYVQIAHAKIDRQRTEIRLLNGVIARRKRSARRLRAYVDAVKQLHRAVKSDTGLFHCKECMAEFPCNTIDAIETVRTQLVEGLKPHGSE